MGNGKIYSVRWVRDIDRDKDQFFILLWQRPVLGHGTKRKELQAHFACAAAHLMATGAWSLPPFVRTGPSWIRIIWRRIHSMSLGVPILLEEVEKFAAEK